MNEIVRLNLAFILFIPWYAILLALFWFYPREPKGLSRRVFDLVSIAGACAAAVISTQWSFHHADRSIDAIWPQVLATAVSYGVFLAALLLAWVARARLFSGPARSACVSQGGHP